jgi:uncharacterized protein (DUF58 family)
VNDFSGMRTYQPGDSPRRIHWANYARTGKLHSKIFVDYQSHDHWLTWEGLPSGSDEQRLSSVRKSAGTGCKSAIIRFAHSRENYPAE